MYIMYEMHRRVPKKSTAPIMERLRNRYAKKWHALFQALLYNSIYCIHFNIKSINIQVVLKILTKKKTHPYE